MRASVILEADIAALVQRAMARRGISFDQAINEAIKADLAGDPGRQIFETPTFRMGKPAVPLTHAARLAAEIEDEEITSKPVPAD